MKEVVMKKLVIILTGALMVMSFAGCQTAATPASVSDAKTEVKAEEPSAALGAEEVKAEETTTETEASAETDADIPEEEIAGDEGLTEDYPDNFMEDRTGQFVFDSYDEVISKLEGEEAYGYAKVTGSDEEVLFITDSTFGGYDAPAAMQCYCYLANADGKYECVGLAFSDSTATPISISEEGYILEGHHDRITAYAFDKDDRGFMAVESLYVEWSDNGETGTYGGFIRESNSIKAPQTEIAADDSASFEKAFAAFDKATPIAFTVVSAK